MPNSFLIFDTFPVGTILPYPSEEAPSGWLICDGREVSRTKYARLFAVIGTRFGAGDGSTTFNLPDLRGRTCVGLNIDDTDFNTIGKTGGEKSHTLTIDELPSHDHVISSVPNHTHSISSDGSHTHYYNVGNPNFLGSYIGLGLSGSNINSSSAGAHNHGGATGSAGAHDHGGLTGRVGGGLPHNNLQPYLVLNFIIKY